MRFSHALTLFVPRLTRNRANPVCGGYRSAMKRLIPLILLVTACDSGQPEERYGFIARLGRDTVSVESVTRRGNTLVSDEVDRFPRVRQRHTEITLDDDGSIRRLVMDIHTPSEPEESA